MADPIPCIQQTSTIDLLIESDYFWDIVGGDKVTLPSGMFMLPSKFGYIVTGRSPGTNKDSQSGNYCALFVAAEFTTEFVERKFCEYSLQCSANSSVVKNPDLEKFWCLETIGITDPFNTDDNDQALRKFCDTVKFENGRYYVCWPWKSDSVVLPDNFHVAVRRMKSLTCRLREDTKLLVKYDSIIKQQLAQQVIERVDDNVPSNTTRTYYLPHHPVLTPGKTTTKIHIVYDASSKVTCYVNSLNECLYRGPVILPDLCGLLIRFRMYPIIILADIEKAFLQVGICEEDRDVTRFLWLDDTAKVDAENNLATYRFGRVPFGMICSPFLLAATIKFHLQKEGTPLALRILNNIYVDNVLVGLDSTSETSGIYEEAKSK